MYLEGYYSRPTQERIAVVGINIVAPPGNNLAEYWRNVCAGNIFVIAKEIRLGERSSYEYVGEVSDLDLSPYASSGQVKRSDRSAHLAIAAGIPALKDARVLALKDPPSKTAEAKYELDIVQADRAGVELGVAAAGLRAAEAAAADIIRRGKPSPRTIPYMNPAKNATELGKLVGFTGRQATHNLACSSGLMGFEEAMDRILRGKADLIVAGGTDSLTHKIVLDGFGMLRVLAKCDPDNLIDASRPLRSDYMGIVMGEGAAMGVLTRLDYALGNGLPVLAELAAIHTFTDPRDELDPTSENVARMLKGALVQAGLTPEDVDELIVHAAGTTGDKSEINGAKEVFKEHAPKVTIRPPKLNSGHLMGGAGAKGLVEAVQSIQTGEIPPIPYGNLIDSQGFDFPNQLRRKGVDVVVVSTLGLDGQYSAGVVVRHQPS